jgi:hypothetical protein
MSARGAFPDRALRIAVAILALGCFAGLAHVISTIGLAVPFDPNEGWNAYHALAAMSGAPLYPDPHSYMTNNYPPLSFYAVGALGRATGDYIVAGRVLSLAALLVVALAIAAIARKLGVTLLEGTFAALLFVAGMLTFTDYVGMNDPQLLGHAIGIAGIVLLLGAPRTDRAIMYGALLLTLAGFVKHNLIAQPLAAGVWLACYDRRSAVRFALCGIAFAGAGLVLSDLLLGTNLLGQLDSARTYSFGAALAGVSHWLIGGALPLSGIAALATFHRDDKGVMFIVLYAAISIVLGAVAMGGAGVDVNAFFDADIALAIGAGLVLNRFSDFLEQRLWLRAAVIAGFLLPFVAGLAMTTDSDWWDGDYWLHPMAEDATIARGDTAFIRAHDGSALCETLSFCFWAGKTPQVDVFNTAQQFATGRRSDKELAGMIDDRKFATLQFDSLDFFALGPHVRAAVDKAYRLDHQDEYGAFFVPR